MGTTASATGSRSLNAVLRALSGIERLGNKLPHPFWLFVILSALLALVSWGLAAAGVAAANPATGKTVVAKNLLSDDGVRMMVGDAIENFTSFPPLGTILVVMLGVAVAERSGLLAAVLRSGVSKVSPKWVTFALSFTGMVAHVASDARTSCSSRSGRWPSARWAAARSWASWWRSCRSRPATTPAR